MQFYRERDIKKERKGESMREVERNGAGERQNPAWKCCCCLLKSEAGPCLHCLGSSGGFGQGGQEENGCWGWGQQRDHHPHKLAEKAPTHWRNTSSLLRNLKKVGSQTSPCCLHVSVHVCWGSDSHTCREATGGHTWGTLPALGDHTRWVALGDRARGLGGLCIAGFLVLGDGGRDDVVQKSWWERR